MKEKLCIWGTGKFGRKIYYLANKKYDIVGFYDNDENKHSKKLYGIRINGWDVKLHTHKIVIASTYWKEIAAQLVKDGMRPFVDFTFPCELFEEYEMLDYRILYELRKLNCDISYKKLFENKKIALIYGNCQTDLIAKSLRTHKRFSCEYSVINIPKVYEYNTDARYVEDFINNKQFLERVDLFIYQQVKKNNRFSPILNTESLVTKLSDSCKKVRIVNIYFSGYFPQYDFPKERIGRDIHQSGIFPFGDKYIDEMLAMGETKNSIIEKIKQEDYISNEEIKKKALDSIEELKKREQEADICITDYIMEHYTNKQLFYSVNHPIEELLIEYTNRILDYIGFDKLNISKIDFCMLIGSLKGQDIPIYPSVIKAFDLVEYEKTIIPTGIYIIIFI